MRDPKFKEGQEVVVKERTTVAVGGDFNTLNFTVEMKHVGKVLNPHVHGGFMDPITVLVAFELAGIGPMRTELVVQLPEEDLISVDAETLDEAIERCSGKEAFFIYPPTDDLQEEGGQLLGWYDEEDYSEVYGPFRTLEALMKDARKYAKTYECEDFRIRFGPATPIPLGDCIGVNVLLEMASDSIYEDDHRPILMNNGFMLEDERQREEARTELLQLLNQWADKWVRNDTFIVEGEKTLTVEVDDDD